MKGFVVGLICGAVLVILALIISGNITGYIIKPIQDKPLETNKPNQITQTETPENNYLDFDSFRVYNPNKESNEAVLIYNLNVDDVSEKIPIIKIMPPLSKSNNYSELSNYLSNTAIKDLTVLSTEDIEIGKIIQNSTGVNVRIKFARA